MPPSAPSDSPSSESPSAAPTAAGLLPSDLRAEVALLGAGRVLTLGFPGLRSDVMGAAYIDPEPQAEVVGALPGLGCGLLIVLVEEEELPEGTLAALAQGCRAQGIALRHAPIEDFSTPDAAFEARWRAEIAPEVRRALAQGKAVGFACHYGAGRSGMMAVRLMMEAGEPCDAALQRLRAQFPESVESAAQIAWLKDHEKQAQARPLGTSSAG